MGGEKRWPLVEGPPISVGRLVLMLTTVGEQLMFFIIHDIISENGLCHKCDQVITGEWVVKGNGRYWRCKDCAVMTRVAKTCQPCQPVGAIFSGRC